MKALKSRGFALAVLVVVVVAGALYGRILWLVG